MVTPAQPSVSNILVAKKPKAPEAPMLEWLLDQHDKEMDEVPWFQDKLELMDHFDSIILSSAKKMGPANRGLAGVSHASGGLGPSKAHQEYKLPIMLDRLKVVKFSADIPL
ncbi:hypothetical protein C0992_003374, partial [Termitomyces sp. T32_za158]